MLREETLNGGRGEFYQFSRGLRVSYNRANRSFDRFEYKKRPLEDGKVLRVGMHDYHHRNLEACLGLSPAELANGKGKVVSSSTLDILVEYFASAHHPVAKVEGRLVIE